MKTFFIQKKSSIQLITLLLLTLCITCDKGIITHTDSILDISIDYISASDIWLYILNPTEYPKVDVEIFVNENLTNKFVLQKKDTLYQISNLQINTENSVQVEYKFPNTLDFITKKFQIATLDTSNDILSFDEYTVGGEFGGYFRDVKALSDNEVWAVGQYTYGNGILNGAKWNGNSWIEQGVPVLIKGSPPDSAFGYGTDLQLVESFGDDGRMFFSSLGINFNLIDTNWTNYTFYSEILPNNGTGFPTDICVFENYIWVSGTNGSLYVWDGVVWKRMQAPSNFDINTISGFNDNGNQSVWIGGKNKLYLKNQSGQWITIMDGNPEIFGLVWAEVRVLRQFNRNNVFVLINGRKQDQESKAFLYRINPEMPQRFILLDMSEQFVNDMAVIGLNEIYMVGSRGDGIAQYNSKRAITYPVLNDGDTYNAVSVSENYIFIVGDRYQKAQIIRGFK